MDYSGEDLEAIFNNDVPHSLQRAIIRCVFNAYGTAFDAVKHFPREEARDLRGYYRWVQLRYEMRGIGDRFPGITATPQDYHTLISSQRIRLIASSATDPESQPRRTLYKLEYANKSLNLYDPMPSSLSTDDYIFTIMAHGVDRREPRQPAFAKILFVTKAMQIWHEFDLFARHMDLAKSLWVPLSATELDGMPDIRLRDEDEEQPQ